MKKLSLLSLVLALAACGGGSGGGGSHGSSPSSAVTPVTLPIPSGLRSGVGSEAATSNGKVTKMNSEVVVATSVANPGGVVVSRSGSKTATEGGYTFTSYMLDDVKLFVADASTTSDGYLLLGLNDDTGRIESMKMVAGGNSENATPAMGRDAETSTFKAPILEYVLDEYVTGSDVLASTLSTNKAIRDAQLQDIKDEHPEWPNKGFWALEGETWKYYERGDEAVFRMVADNTTSWDTLVAKATEKGLSGGHWNRTYENMPVKTYGNGINGEGVDGKGHSLQYSDFGHFNPVYETKRVYLKGGNEVDGWEHDSTKGSYKENDKLAEELAAEDYQLFAGGYAINGNSMSDDRPSLDPVVGTTYKGMAIGRVYTSIEGDGDISDILTAYGITSGDGHDISKAFTTHKAEMKITQSGGQIVQTLKMPFYTNPDDSNSKYYDITIVKTGDNISVPTFKAGGKNGTDESQIESQYRLHGADQHWDTAHASFNPGYYGVNTPSEAAGTAAIRAGYEVHDTGNTISADRDYEVQAAYGLIKQ